MSDKSLSTGAAARGAVDAFLKEARDVAAAQGAARRGRLIFALDATMSRQPTWDLAQSIQGEMFETTAAQGGLEAQLVYFRGFAECRSSAFVGDGRGLAALMTKISCHAGRTQIAKVLRHALSESRKQPVGAMIYIGDAMEENADALGDLAGQLGLLGVKIFVFHEGGEVQARQAFQEMARISGGAYAAFDSSAPRRLAELLKAAAAYAAGGLVELERRAAQGEEAARLLLSQL